jgi:esterase
MLKLHHRIKGEGDSVIIMLHGLFGSLENLGGIGRLLADQLCVHSLDLRNHGRSPHHPQMNYQNMATDIINYMNDAGLEKAHLLGHSMGGKTAMQLALSNPERVKSLIVADIAPVHYPPHHDEVFEGLRQVEPAQLQSRQQADELLKNTVPELAVRQFLLKNLVKEGAGGFYWRMNLAAINHNYAHIMAGLHHDQAFSGKVLFIKGGTSDYIKPQYRDHTLLLFPNAEVKVMPNTGHWLHAEKPDLFAAIVKRFLKLNE